MLNKSSKSSNYKPYIPPTNYKIECPHKEWDNLFWVEYVNVSKTGLNMEVGAFLLGKPFRSNGKCNNYIFLVYLQ